MASGTANGTAHEELSFLPRLTQSFGSIQQSPTIETEGFCQAMALILPVFDQLGGFFQFAKSEMSGKVDSLREGKGGQPTLDTLVQNCIKDKSVTTKGSSARNLHRLVSAVDFIKVLMANLGKDPKMTLHNACYDAYNKTMANIHTFVVRTAVKAGMYTLPTRENFLKSIGETDYVVAKGHAQDFVGVAESLIGNVLALFTGTSMPRSDSTFTG